MYIPDEPPIGNLVAYEYLWLSQHYRREDGAKVYPVALIFAKKIIASVTPANRPAAGAESRKLSRQAGGNSPGGFAAWTRTTWGNRPVIGIYSACAG